MKFLILTVLITTLAFTKAVHLDEEALKKIQETAGECKTKTGASDADMQRMMKHETPETKEGKCFLACMKKTLGFMNADNSLNVELIRQRMADHVKDEESKTKGMEIVDLCVKEVPTMSDECEMASKLMECCVKHSKEMGISALNIVGV